MFFLNESIVEFVISTIKGHLFKRVEVAEERTLKFCFQFYGLRFR